MLQEHGRQEPIPGARAKVSSMVPNHRQLIGLLAGSDPEFVAGDFATRFASGRDGEIGSFLYFRGGFWDVRVDGSVRLLLAPWGRRVEPARGAAEDGPAMRTLPCRPPWSMVLPRYSSFLGRADDDWQMDACCPVVEDTGSLTAALTNLEDPAYTGTLTVSAETYTITTVDLGHMVQSLAIVRSQPVGEDLAALEFIKTSVKKFGGDK